MVQCKLNQTLERIRIIADNLIVGEGDSEVEAIQDCEAKLQQLLKRCREQNIKLNSDKLKLRRTEAPYIGHFFYLGRSPVRL